MAEGNPGREQPVLAYDVSRPHDSLFRAVFSDPDAAIAMLRAYLPESVSACLRWATLNLQGTSFLDSDLRRSEADLLYAIRHQSGRPLWLYVLLEHQSKPDRWLRLRLLRYCCRIWERDRRTDQRKRTLRPIVPLVLHHGPTRWTHSREFSELFAVGLRQWPWLPHCEHLLIDLAAAPLEAVRGELKGRLAQLTMIAAYRNHRRVIERVLPLLAELYRAGEVDAFGRQVLYIYTTQRREIREWFAAEIRRRVPERGGDVLNYVKQLVDEGIQRGRQEGRQEGEVAIIERLARAGVEWSLIESATGIDQDALRALKRKLGAANGAGDETR